MPELSDSQIRAVVDRIFDECAPEKVIVFGSQVSGETDEWSDLDVVIVAEGSNDDLKELQSRLYQKLADSGFSKDLIVLSPARYEFLREVQSSIISQAEREGAVTFSKPPRSHA